MDIALDPENQANDHISITNDEAAMAWRLNVTDVDVPVDDTGVGYVSVMSAARPAKDGLLIVASGLGGLKVVRLRY